MGMGPDLGPLSNQPQCIRCNVSYFIGILTLTSMLSLSFTNALPAPFQPRCYAVLGAYTVDNQSHLIGAAKLDGFQLNSTDEMVNGLANFLLSDIQFIQNLSAQLGPLSAKFDAAVQNATAARSACFANMDPTKKLCSVAA